MSKHLILTVIIVAILGLSASAEIPLYINYQGQLTDDTGEPVNDGIYQINFMIFGSESGADLLWESGGHKVGVTDGRFSVVLGRTTPLPDTLFAGGDTRYLGLTINSGDELTPRTRLNSSAYAFQALRAETAETVVPNSISGSHVVNGSLNSADIGDDPGVAYAYKGNPAYIYDPITYVDSVTVNAPASGFVFVSANAYVGMYPEGGSPPTMGNVRFLVVDSPDLTSLPIGSNSLAVVGGANVETADDGIRWYSPYMSGMFEIPGPGTYTFYLVGDRGFEDGLAQIDDLSLIAMFFPTAYGTVEKTAEAQVGGDHEIDETEAD